MPSPEIYTLSLHDALPICSNMATPKEDCEKLMNSLLPFAEKMLREHGEFHPFGGAMKPDGDIVHHGAYTGQELPKGQELVDLLDRKSTRLNSSHTVISYAVTRDLHSFPTRRSSDLFEHGNTQRRLREAHELASPLRRKDVA